jgi:hypothetical protein
MHGHLLFVQVKVERATMSSTTGTGVFGRFVLLIVLRGFLCTQFARERVLFLRTNLSRLD